MRGRIDFARGWSVTCSRGRRRLARADAGSLNRTRFGSRPNEGGTVSETSAFGENRTSRFRGSTPMRCPCPRARHDRRACTLRGRRRPRPGGRKLLAAGREDVHRAPARAGSTRQLGARGRSHLDHRRLHSTASRSTPGRPRTQRASRPTARSTSRRGSWRSPARPSNPTSTAPSPSPADDRRRRDADRRRHPQLDRHREPRRRHQRRRDDDRIRRNAGDQRHRRPRGHGQLHPARRRDRELGRRPPTSTATARRRSRSARAASSTRRTTRRSSQRLLHRRQRTAAARRGGRHADQVGGHRHEHDRDRRSTTTARPAPAPAH